MDFFGSYKSPFGYENGINGGVDSYGVDHSGFSTQDELQYQTARTIREQQMANDMVKQGIAVENYPQYGTNFWGDSANNYGFGNSNIGQNIQNVTNQLNNNGFNSVNVQNNIQQLRMPTGSEQQITMPSYGMQQQLQQPQTNAWNRVKNAANNFAGGTEAFSVGYATGATLGNFDEGMGAATAAVTLTPNNYAIGRDATRQLQNNLQHQHPWAYSVGEFAGAMTTPMHLAKGKNFKQKAFNALTDTLNASAGYAGNLNDFVTNLAANGAANVAGLALDKIPYTRGGGIVGRKFIKQGINSFADKMKNIFYKNDDDEEKYNY